jgi:hypothetical protein
MRWLRRHAWWGLLAVSVMIMLFGATDIASGAAADGLIPQALTGKTIQQLGAESADAYGMFDFTVRSNGWSLVLLGLLLALIVLIPFRRGERWAWWAAWALPIWAAVVPIFYLVAGVHPDQPPPPPMVSGPTVAIICAAILLVTRPSPERTSKPDLTHGVRVSHTKSVPGEVGMSDLNDKIDLTKRADADEGRPK